ncbi:hypothetical protein P153DRAFT_395962 [Dothidotthia symphoricarpi CBS 119687]|uniref:histidine kinase n=1 Tax=Dothidotthia symphoricarpi CBS 119687 TaxID=1392245 RepID=A0A6A6AHJ1_9PLEO|nr:uncharacterized protein P153DRAFT_395962 [Dothidotthia symphoricarpi CBS 119687]KAF2130565.1 hypothetical protein P153DRAFT_395962 [Dothidotthia symphoricarpi CBS 119687]
MLGPSEALARSYARARKKMEQVDLAKEREFYRYYPQHTRSNPVSRQPSPAPVPAPAERLKSRPSTPPPSLPEDDVPHPSDDRALTAFAQLGALRLNTRRCLISFFDRKNCFILAEATRSLSLQSGQAEFGEDALCWGSTIFSKEKSICYYTVNLVPVEYTLPVESYANVPSLVVNDLSKDDRFKHYPFVVGPPYSRFYAGVPIRSPSGHSIGTYCVLDDKPRNGLSPHEMNFLKDMGATVMRHLEMTRATEDQRRGKIMVKSLGSFAEGKSGLEEWWWDQEQEQPLSAGTPGAPSQRQRPAALSNASQHSPMFERNDSAASSVVTVRSPTSSVQPPSTAMTPTSDAIPEVRPSEVAFRTSSNKDDQTNRVAPEIKAAFTRAANMIVEATEADGAAFFDAKISTFGGLVDDDFVSEQLPEPDKPCILLGAALSKYGRDSASASDTEYAMSESVLRHLLRSYAHGQIFNFDDNASNSPINSPSASSEQETSDGFPFTASRRSESTRSLDDENFLRSAFPKAKSLVLYPLWDPHRDRWFASAVIWSSDPMRVFTSEQELSYLAAFSNSVMAEVARLDTKLADAAKADFISSISHELRSPLHGILGMTDLLKDSPIDNQQTSHVATIETCGKTLLETINHVLDFAKINNLTRGSAKRQKKRSHGAKQMISPGQGHTNDIMTLINDVDMSVLTEDVVESVFAGYTYAKTSAQAYDAIPSKSNVPPISLVLDINRSDNYVFRTQPGAWRRVIMNLFGNSLKYSPAGYIKVKLEVKRKSKSTDGCCEFRFTVTDSGIGMSEDYVNNRLFHSFAQENPLSQGTGLGLSIVKQIVESLGGEVEVRSEKGRGTKITVSCPLKESVMSPTFCATGPEKEKERHLQDISKRTKGMRVRFIGFEETGEYFVKDLKNQTAAKLSLKALHSLCADWFGMEICGGTKGPAPAEPDLIVATESVAAELRERHSQNPDKACATPVIVICQGAASAQSAMAMTVPGIIFECIGQPVGPHKMAKALSSCLDRYANPPMIVDTTTDPSLQEVSSLNLKENTLPHRLMAMSDVDPSRPLLTSVSSAPEIRSTTPVPIRKSMYSKPSRSLNCLAVDDNPINLRLLRTFVDKLGHRHVLAANGLEALEEYKAVQTPPLTTASLNHPTNAASRIDVVLMDINMPVMDGLEATRQIRAHEIRNGLPKTTIIALTGVADADIQQEASASGINLFLIKPVRLADLEAVLKGVIVGQDKTTLEFQQEKERAETVGRSVTLDSVDEMKSPMGVDIQKSCIENDQVRKQVRIAGS